jgi:hypothetical protein
MAHHVDRVREDVKIAAIRSGSAVAATGWVFLCFAAMAGIFFFQTLRSGTEMWRIFTIVTALIGIVLIGYGERNRRLNS